jgi:large subunit ribosomal protein L16
MVLFPSKFGYLIMFFKKQKKQKNKQKVVNNYLSIIRFGFYGIKSLNNGVLTVKQLESCRRVIARATRKICKIFLRIFFHQPITQKGIKLRMGRGCGKINRWVFYIKSGLVILETTRVSISFFKILFNSFKIGSFKLPIPVFFIYRSLTI